MPAEPRRDAALRQFETLWPLSESLLRISNTIALLPPQVRSGAARRPGRMGHSRPVGARTGSGRRAPSCFVEKGDDREA